MAMTQVSADQAMQSRYYGVKGWLLVIYVLYVLSALSTLSNALAASDAMAIGLDPGLWRMIAIVQLALTLPFLIMTPMKHRLMPMVAIACLWISVAITLLLYAANWSSIMMAMEDQMRTAAGQSAGAMSDEMFGAIGQFGIMVGIGFGMIFAALMTWFLLASKRVNATFLHRIPNSEAMGMAEPAQARAPMPGMDEMPPTGAPSSPGSAV